MKKYFVVEGRCRVGVQFWVQLSVMVVMVLGRMEEGHHVGHEAANSRPSSTSGLLWASSQRRERSVRDSGVLNCPPLPDLWDEARPAMLK